MTCLGYLVSPFEVLLFWSFFKFRPYYLSPYFTVGFICYYFLFLEGQSLMKSFYGLGGGAFFFLIGCFVSSVWGGWSCCLAFCLLFFCWGIGAVWFLNNALTMRWLDWWAGCWFVGLFFEIFGAGGPVFFPVCLNI